MKRSQRWVERVVLAGPGWGGTARARASCGKARPRRFCGLEVDGSSSAGPRPTEVGHPSGPAHRRGGSCARPPPGRARRRNVVLAGDRDGPVSRSLTGGPRRDAEGSLYVSGRRTTSKTGWPRQMPKIGTWRALRSSQRGARRRRVAGPVREHDRVGDEPRGSRRHGVPAGWRARAPRARRCPRDRV